ncbi:alpha/beta-hydrolase [Athelia psychrophila]|uniref:Alpha/beta-hydrolase n=1 Tax=Athelia psychrophila TaxID=1759441 RepID=A0A166DSS7_9AGAM|nr:alpha/beta-hydrolase [Fibularhizoctonia sp. CBS 109695]
MDIVPAPRNVGAPASVTVNVAGVDILFAQWFVYLNLQDSVLIIKSPSAHQQCGGPICFSQCEPYTGNTSAPTVKLDAASVTGVTSNITGSSIKHFLGIPFAKPPSFSTGSLRYRQPVLIESYNTSLSATEYGPYCLQIPVDFATPGAPPAVEPQPQSEDCLTINVVQPAGYEDAKLPVIAVRFLHYIFEGGFDAGDPAADYGSVIVQKSIDIGSPVVYASFKYRVNGFGFLASQEVTDEGVGNLDLQDQRQALRWIQKYISSFGGDSTKVTLLGESSGAISVAIQLVLNNGDTEGLFRAAWSMSGAPWPAGSYTHGQKWYNGAVAATNCTGATDTLQCLRDADVGALHDYFSTTPSKGSYQERISAVCFRASFNERRIGQALNSAWLPRVDGKFLKDDPQQLVMKGRQRRKYSFRFWFVMLRPHLQDHSLITFPGNCDDEGTLFTFNQQNITTDTEFNEFVHTALFPNATNAEIDVIAKLYPSDPSQGSPFGTGDSNTLWTQYKRLAAVQSDLWHGPRRFRASLQNAWSYLDKRNKTSSPIGSAHETDLHDMYGTGNGTELQDYVINLAYNLNPNGPTVSQWPQYKVTSPELLTLLDGATPSNITEDTLELPRSRPSPSRRSSLNTPSNGLREWTEVVACIGWTVSYENIVNLGQFWRCFGRINRTFVDRSSSIIPATVGPQQLVVDAVCRDTLPKLDAVFNVAEDAIDSAHQYFHTETSVACFLNAV